MTPSIPRDLSQHLSGRDIQILEDLEQYRLLTTRHLQRLHLPIHPFGSHASLSAATRGTTRIMRRLESLNVVARIERRIGGQEHGSALIIWQLGRTGERFLRQRRGDTRRIQFLEPGQAFTSHTLAVADVAVALREHATAQRFELLALEPEPRSWRTFEATTGLATLKPDLYAITADPTTETHSFIEVDLGTEHPPVIVRKCRTYERYYRTGSEQAQHGLFPAVVWLVPTTKRVVALTAAVAAARDLDAGLFWITTTDQALAHLAPYPMPGISPDDTTT